MAQQLLVNLQLRANSQEILDLLQLLKLRLEEARDDLVRCSAADFPSLQAEAKVYDKLIRDITRPNPLEFKEV